MNLTELNYVVETAFCGSVNGAAKKLSVAQPNISRAIRNLETEFRIRIFERSAKGVELTYEGQIFLEHAKKILNEADRLSEHVMARKKGTELKIAIPKESYASFGFVNFVRRIVDVEHIGLHIRECNFLEAMDCILKSDYQLAMIRFDKQDEEYYRSILQLKRLAYEEIMEYQNRLFVNKGSPLTKMKISSYEDLEGFIEIRQGDEQRLNRDHMDVLDPPESVRSGRRIYVYERGSQIALLKRVEMTYMWESPMSQETLDAIGLVQIECPWQKKWMKDILVYPGRQKLKGDELIFLEEIRKEAEVVLGSK